mmetsp:Transcript_24183/g.69530  ORF Transcript_24183/g.69530 Transcript_24183/m.69530 type:complete len:82 (-) Transcript_24183:1619-1864(-)
MDATVVLVSAGGSSTNTDTDTIASTTGDAAASRSANEASRDRGMLVGADPAEVEDARDEGVHAAADPAGRGRKRSTCWFVS